jgi:hypothetical protein
VRVTVGIVIPTSIMPVPSTFQAQGNVSNNGKANMRAYLLNSADNRFYGTRLDGGSNLWAFQFSSVPAAFQHWVTLIVSGIDGDDIGSAAVDIQVGP